MGSKSEKISGVGAPLWGNLMGKLKLWPQISRPLIIRGRRLGVGSTREPGPYLIYPNPQPRSSNLGGKKCYEKFFFGRKLQGQIGGKFSGNTAGPSYTVPIAFCRGGIAIVRLRFGTGSPGNWGSHGPPKLGQILDTFQMPPKNAGGGRGKFSP